MTKSWLSWRENCYLYSTFREVATLDFLNYVARKSINIIYVPYPKEKKDKSKKQNLGSALASQIVRQVFGRSI